MKNNLINKVVSLLLCLIVICVFNSCDRDVESLEVKAFNIEEQNPKLYEQYLEDLRSYRNTDHKVIYAWFDNSEKKPESRGHHITSLPDSVDYIIIKYSDDLTDWQISEMEKVREKGINILAEFDFDVLKNNYDAIIDNMERKGESTSGMTPFIDILVDTMDITFKTLKKYNYDGLVIGYKGKSVLHMTETEKADFAMYQNAFINVTSIWKENNPDKTIIFSGKPQHVLDKSVLSSYKHIIIPTSNAKSLSEVVYEVTMASAEGVPTDRFVVTAETLSIEEGDTKTGLWADGKQAISEIADYAVAYYEGYSIIGMGINNANRDYYNTKSPYYAIRNVIQVFNPSLK